MKVVTGPLFAAVLFVISHSKCFGSEEEEVCRLLDSGVECSSSKRDSHLTPKVTTVLYDVNGVEGFNLRRDVALRIVGMVERANRSNRRKGRPLLRLALPPWPRLYHWRTPTSPGELRPWSDFFDVGALRSYLGEEAVIEALDLLEDGETKVDVVYKLRHYEDPFEGGSFVDKWERRSECDKSVNLWGLDVRIGRVECIAFQGAASKLIEVIDSDPQAKIITFTNAEVALHDEYATSSFWRARRAFAFNKDLLEYSQRFIREHLGKGDYLSIHWRRGDFVRGRRKTSPSIAASALQIAKFASARGLREVFLASDAQEEEAEDLISRLQVDGLEVVRFRPTEREVSSFGDGGVAIIDQIVCSRGGFFVGTHESTFTFRIQEEREIGGFDSDSTFNRLCPDEGECERPSRWTIVD